MTCDLPDEIMVSSNYNVQMVNSHDSAPVRYPEIGLDCGVCGIKKKKKKKKKKEKRKGGYLIVVGELYSSSELRSGSSIINATAVNEIRES